MLREELPPPPEESAHRGGRPPSHSILREDLHTHLLPGVDDGSRSPVETIAMARGLKELGVERVYLTPHQFKLGNRLTLVEVQRRTDDVWRVLARAGVSLEVRRGAEHYYGEELLDAISGNGELLTMPRDEGEHLLVELPMHQPAVGVTRVGEALARRGITPVMAHPERIAGISRELGRIEAWVEAGWRLQVNLLSLVGRHGREAEEVGAHLVREGRYHFAGSDLHRPAELLWLRRAHAAHDALSPREVHR